MASVVVIRAATLEESTRAVLTTCGTIGRVRTERLPDMHASTHLQGVDDSSLEHVDLFIVVGIIPHFLLPVAEQIANDKSSLNTY